MSSKMKLKRFVRDSVKTIGRFTYENLSLFSVELPWRDNQTDISCIPDGTYKVQKVNSPSHGEGTWRIMEVCDRTFIDIHVANVPSDLLGCVGLGIAVYPDLRGVGSSRIAMGRFKEATKDISEAIIEISTEVLR